jgi:hypothetical protein
MKAIKLLVLSVLAMLPCEAALLAGSEPKEWPADPSRHVVSVERVFQNESEAALITAAEHFAPNEKELAAEAQKQDPAAKIVAKQWWYQESLGVKIPFTLTAEAVLYYSELVHGFGKQKLVRYTSPVSRFSYKASVSKRDSIEHGGVTFTKVSVVTLTMSFSEHFVTTMTEGMDFTKVREVVFDADGKVLFTRGDGATEVPIMAI